jgi:hypothetical protein
VTHQSPGLPVMPVGARGVHLSKQIDLMAEVTAIGFVVPTLDPHNGGANAAGGEGDEGGDAAIVGACAAGAAESKGDGVGKAPQLEPREAGAVEGEVMKPSAASCITTTSHQKCVTWSNR